MNDSVPREDMHPNIKDAMDRRNSKHHQISTNQGAMQMTTT